MFSRTKCVRVSQLGPRENRPDPSQPPNLVLLSYALLQEHFTFLSIYCICIIDAYNNNYAKCEDGDKKDGQVGDSVSEVEGNGVVILQEQHKSPCSD